MDLLVGGSGGDRLFLVSAWKESFELFHLVERVKPSTLRSVATEDGCAPHIIVQTVVEQGTPMNSD